MTIHKRLWEPLCQAGREWEGGTWDSGTTGGISPGEACCRGCRKTRAPRPSCSRLNAEEAKLDASGIWWALQGCLCCPFLYTGPGDREDTCCVLPCYYLNMWARKLWQSPYRLHGAACNDHWPAFLHHLGKVHSWVQEQEFEAALSKGAGKTDRQTRGTWMG